MISRRIKLEIENSPVIKNITGVNGINGDWGNFTRTVFERIARKINQVTTQKVMEMPYLVKDFLLLGQDEFENIKFKYQLNNTDDFIEHLKNINNQKPYNWISGKTLQGYWNNSNAKDKKLNVLLAFLGVGMHEWDEWKAMKPGPGDQTRSLGYSKFSDNETGTLKLLKNILPGFITDIIKNPTADPSSSKRPW
ncbi:MAG: hypothetical protein HC819_14315 [Cyclobacteriaceae bacterium]|nr:hypothetical protein [Cyclobacteriaceae bacterium]